MPAKKPAPETDEKPTKTELKRVTITLPPPARAAWDRILASARVTVPTPDGKTRPLEDDDLEGVAYSCLRDAFLKPNDPAGHY